MALGATLYHLRIDLSDVDRGVYQSLDLRVARHPSESMRYLLTRVLAYCLCHEDGIAFSRGLSTTDEPAVWARDLQGNVRLWIEVGAPSPERLHKASKASPRLVVFTYGDAAPLHRSASTRSIHRAQEIIVHAVPTDFLDALDAATDRNSQWVLVHTGGEVFVTVADKTISGTISRQPLSAGEAA
jgi:uncharacterized protein YaeQ